MEFPGRARSRPFAAIDDHAYDGTRDIVSVLFHPNSANLFHGRSPLSEIHNDLILATQKRDTRASDGKIALEPGLGDVTKKEISSPGSRHRHRARRR